jgi:hypothetical protein
MTESETPRTDAIWQELKTIPTTAAEKWLDSLCGVLEEENADLKRIIRMWEHGEFRAMKLFKELKATEEALDQMARAADATARDRDEWMTRALVAQAKEAK